PAQREPGPRVRLRPPPVVGQERGAPVRRQRVVGQERQVPTKQAAPPREPGVRVRMRAQAPLEPPVPPPVLGLGPSPRPPRRSPPARCRPRPSPLLPPGSRAPLPKRGKVPLCPPC